MQTSLQRLCRTCLYTSNNVTEFISISTIDPIKKISTRSKMEICIPEIEVEDSDNTFLCIACWNALNVSYNFKCTCLNTEEKLRESTYQFGEDVSKLPSKDVFCTEVDLLLDEILTSDKTRTELHREAEFFLETQKFIKQCCHSQNTRKPDSIIKKPSKNTTTYVVLVCKRCSREFCDTKKYKRHRGRCGKFIAFCKKCGKGFYFKLSCSQHERICTQPIKQRSQISKRNLKNTLKEPSNKGSSRTSNEQSRKGNSNTSKELSNKSSSKTSSRKSSRNTSKEPSNKDGSKTSKELSNKSSNKTSKEPSSKSISNTSKEQSRKSSSNTSVEPSNKNISNTLKEPSNKSSSKTSKEPSSKSSSDAPKEQSHNSLTNNLKETKINKNSNESIVEKNDDKKTNYSQCPLCPLIVRNNWSLRRHVARRHSKENSNMFNISITHSSKVSIKGSSQKIVVNCTSTAGGGGEDEDTTKIPEVKLEEP